MLSNQVGHTLCMYVMYVMADILESVPNSVKPKPCHDKKRIHNATGNAKIKQKNLIKVRFSTVDNDKCKSSRNLCFVNAKYKVKMKYEVSLLKCVDSELADIH